MRSTWRTSTCDRGGRGRMTEVFRGGCHCGALATASASARPLAPRTCQCGLCRRHGARTATDPDGAATLSLGAAPNLYRFATRSSDFVLCGRCGTYLGAMVEIDGGLYATLNLNAFADPRLDLHAVPVSYDGETSQAKAARRRRAWPPARLA